MALIELRDVTKSYKRDAIEIPVLDRVSITVDAGDFLGLMGPSGSGKSTLLNLIAGIDRPTRGSIRDRRHRDQQPVRARARRVARAARRLHLPALQPDSRC